MKETTREERNQLYSCLGAAYGVRPRDMQRLKMGHLIMEWLVKGPDLRVHFFWYLDPTRIHEDEYWEEIIILHKRGQLPMWPRDFSQVAYDLLCELFYLKPKEFPIRMEWIPELASWDCIIPGVCKVAAPTDEKMSEVIEKVYSAVAG